MSAMADLKKIIKNWRAIAVSGFSQVVSSLSNFIIVMMLVRLLDKASFGLYVSGFSVAMIVGGVLSEFASVSLGVGLALNDDKDKEKKALYYFVFVLVIATGLTIISALTIYTLGVRFFSLESPLFWVCAIAAGGVFGLKEILVRLLYALRQERYVLFANVVVLITSVLVVYIFNDLIKNNSVELSMIPYLSGCVFGVLYIFVSLRIFYPVGLENLLSVWGECWSRGRWQLVASAASNMRSQIYSWGTLFVFGASITAEIAAARVLMTPAMLALPPMSQLLMPRLLVLNNSEREKIIHRLIAPIALSSLISIGYTFVLILFLPKIVPMVLGVGYENVDFVSLLFFWGAVTAILSARTFLTVGLQVSLKFRSLATSHLAGLLVGFLVFFIAAEMSITESGVISIVASELFISSLFCYRLVVNKNIKVN